MSPSIPTVASNPIINKVSSATAIPVNSTEILEWIKGLVSNIGNKKTVYNEQETPVKIGPLSKPSPVPSSLSRPDVVAPNTDTRLLALVTKPATTTPRTDRYTTLTTTTARTIGDVVSNVLSQSVVPLAGFSAATLAYGAAATLPVWLPLALGKRKRRRRRRKRSYKDDKRLDISFSYPNIYH